ncbi:MAG TPA: isoprenylcysteine carboxylmethyltransferase family protein [Desulfomonilia bacterium]|nr:isoprenylcysteine carboxylmethyltransferase family protein [Desulfomonilia bacterium]
MADEMLHGRIKASVLIYATLTIGLGSFIMFSLFLFLGSFTLLNLGLHDLQALLFDSILSLLFFLQHSIMVRKGVRMGLSELIPDDYYNAFYAVSSGITLLAAILFWQRIPGPIFTAPGVFYWMLRALFFLCIAGFRWGEKSLGSFDPLGVKRVRRLIQNRGTKIMPLTLRGAYQWMRHPLYFFSLVMIWSCPVLTSDRLLFNVLWTIWIVIATLLEERDLVMDFGDQYRQYQARVPMIIPYKLPARMDKDPLPR